MAFYAHNILGAIGEENTIQMVYFVLEYLRQEAASTSGEARTVRPPCRERDPFVAIDGAVDAPH